MMTTVCDFSIAEAVAVSASASVSALAKSRFMVVGSGFVLLAEAEFGDYLLGVERKSPFIIHE